MDTSLPQGNESKRKLQIPRAKKGIENDGAYESVKRRATGNLVSAAERVDSGLGDDADSGRRSAMSQFPEANGVSMVSANTNDIDLNGSNITMTERRQMAQQQMQSLHSHYANDPTIAQQRPPEPKRTMEIMQQSQSIDPPGPHFDNEEHDSDRRSFERTISNMRAQELYRDSILQPGYAEKMQLFLAEHRAMAAPLAQRASNVRTFKDYCKVNHYARNHAMTARTDVLDQARQGQIDHDIERRSMLMPTLQDEQVPRRAVFMGQQQSRQKNGWYRDTSNHSLAKFRSYENSGLELKGTTRQSFPARNWEHDSSTSALEPKIRKQHAFKKISIESLPVNSTTTEKNQDREPSRRAMDVRQMQKQIIMARYQDPPADSNARFNYLEAGHFYGLGEGKIEASVCKTSLYSPPATSRPYKSQQDGSSPYHKLPHEDSLRLLHVMPGLRSDPIICEMETTRLQQPHSFEAISYVWGSEANKRSMFCNGKPVQITQNLYDALQRLRYEGQQRCIWADAVCIDQTNTSERGHQVRLMRSIYRAASRVVIWLGNDLIGDAYRACTIICGIANSHLKGSGQGETASFTQHAQSTLAIREPPPFDSEEWTSVSRFYDRDWFWRLWCVQEVALASDAIMIWGNEIEIPWKWVGLAAARIRTNNYQVLQRHQMAGVFNAYLMYRISLNASDLPPLSLSIPFVRLLGLTRQFEAKDPRDRIFGLLGLPTNDSSPDENRLFMEPDYNIPVLETYRNLALKVLFQARNCDILSSVQHGEALDHEFPSWVPRWDKVYTLIICASDSETKFSACGSCLLPLEAGYVHSNKAGEGKDVAESDTDYLHLQGLVIDNIFKFVIMEASEPAGSTNTPTTIGKLGTHFMDSQIRIGVKRVCWVLTAGKDWYGTPVTDDLRHLADFHAALKSVLPTIETTDIFGQYTLPPAHSDDADRFHQSAANACKGRKLFFTDGGKLGLGPMAMQQGDVLCVLFGGSVPYVLRIEGDLYRLVGECYVHDLMNGEAVAAMEEGRLEKMWFKLR